MTWGRPERGDIIERTAALAARLGEENERELKERYARRNRIRVLDDLLEEFETMNLRGEPDVSPELVGRVYRLAQEGHHLILKRLVHDIDVSGWTDTVYELQDPLLLNPFEDDLD